MITTGFDAMRTEIRSEISGLEHRMNRRFDRLESIVDGRERRITALEAGRPA